MRVAILHPLRQTTVTKVRRIVHRGWATVGRVARGHDLVRARYPGARVPRGRRPRRVRARGARARRAHDSLLRPVARLRAAARVARRAPRRRRLAHLPDERLAARASSSSRAVSRPASACSSSSPTYDRPLKILRELGAEIVPLTCDDDGLDPDALEAALARGEPPAFLYLIPTFQNPSGRTLPAERRRRDRRARARARPARARGRPVRPRPLRGRAAAVALRALRRRGRLQLVVLEDDRARSARRLVRAARGARPRGRGDRDGDLHHAGAARARRPSTSSSPAGCSSRTSSA